MADQNIVQLIARVPNPHQQKNLEKLLGGASSQIYLVEYEDYGVGSVEGIITVLGAMNSRGKREEYKVKLYKQHLDNVKGSFYCSCPDHKFGASKKEMVCKHICFVMCKVAKIFDPVFFATKKLSDDQFATVKEKLGNALRCDPNICRPPSHLTMALFKKRAKPIEVEDMCPICYDSLNDNLLSCPSCSNYVHDGCMRVWLERQGTCVYCRSDVWTQFDISL